MVKVVFVERSGVEHIVEGAAGTSAMEAASRNGIEGIAAECGGACSCATCHVVVDQVWYNKLGPPGEMEEAMLEFAGEITPTSRLSCQITLSSTLDGIKLTIPDKTF